MDPGGSPHSPGGDTAVPDESPKYQRSLRSLNALATRFVRLLQEAEGGVLDLKDVSELRGPQSHSTAHTGPITALHCSAPCMYDSSIPNHTKINLHTGAQTYRTPSKNAIELNNLRFNSQFLLLENKTFCFVIHV